MRNVNPARLATFADHYAVSLLLMVGSKPEKYCYGLDAVPGVVEKMRKAFADGSYHHVGDAVKLTCKNMAIPYTRTGIEAYLTAHSD